MAEEPIILAPKEAWIEKFSKTKVGKVITSPKTTAVLGGILATLVGAGAVAPQATGAALRAAPSALGKTAVKAAKAVAPKSVSGAVKTVAGAGIVAGLGASGIKSVTEKVFKTGKAGGEILAGKKTIQDVLGIEKGSDLLTKENLVKAAKAAGIIGAGALGVAGIKKAIENYKEKKQAQPIPTDGEYITPQPGFTEPLPVGVGGIPTSIPTQISASGAPQSKITPNPIQNIIQISVA